MFRRFSFWLTVFAIFMDLLHIVGMDDNVLLYLTSPPSWFIEPFDIIPRPFRYLLIYIANIAFWFFVGFYIDKLFEKRRGAKQQ